MPTAVVHAFAPGGAEVAVLERYTADAPSLEQLEKDARVAMSLRHPNVAAVRDVWREGGELCIASEWVEGETLEELRRLGAGGKDLSIEVGVRVIVDLLGALSALHTLGAGGLAHGEVTTTTVIVGFDGTTRVVRPYRGRMAGKLAEPDWFSYAAPELVRGGAADPRADLYAVGVLLWETLSRRKLFPKATREGRAARTMPVGKPTAPAEAAWAAPLAAVAERALANDPAARYTSAAEMAAAVRLAVRSKLAMPPRVAAAVDKLAGDKILARRTANALPEVDTTGARLSGRPSRPSLPPDAVRALSKMRPSSRPPTPKPGLVAMPPVPKAPPVPSIAAPAEPGPKLEQPRTGPRPFAPALNLTPPLPKVATAPPPKPEPSEAMPLDDAFLEIEPPTAPNAQLAPLAPTPSAVAPIAAAAPPAAIEPIAGLPSKRNNRAILIAAVVLIGLVAVASVLRMALSSSSASKVSPTRPVATQTATPESTATATTKATATATATTTTAPADSASAAPDTSSSAEPDNAQPAPTEHHHARPRPTYDPMGI